MADGNSFWYAEGPARETVIYKVDPVAGTKTPLFDTERVRRALAAALGREPPQAGLPFRAFRFTNKAESAVAFTVGSDEFELDLGSYTVTRPPARPEAEVRRTTAHPIRNRILGTVVQEIASPDGRWFATEKDDGLWLRSATDGSMHPLITDGGPGYAWRIDRFEWNIDRAKWSPDGTKLAAFKIDTRQTDSFPIVDWLDLTEEVAWWPITRAGRPLERTELHIVDVGSRTAVLVPTGNDDHYLFTIGWTPDGSELLFLRMRRDHKQLDLLAADPNTGASRVVVSETQKTFVGGTNWRNLQPTLLPDGKRFVWMSERDGWNHLYLHGLDGTLIRRLTQGEWPVLEVEAVDPAGGWVYFTAHAEARVYDIHLYRVRLDGTGFTRLTQATGGEHAVRMSPSTRYFLDTHESVARAPATELRAADGRLILTLATTDTTALAELRWTPPEEFVVKAADGVTDLHGQLFKPYDFDPSRSYPVIDYIYNGPNDRYVRRTFTSHANRNHEAQALAHLGFITFLVDGRGTPGRGKAFLDVVYQNVGQHEIPDHVATLRQLAHARPYMDLDRVGILGTQWPGSYMALRGMLTAPEVYKVGVVRMSTVADISGWPANLIEPYMGLPQDNPAAYEAASSLPYAKDLKGKLLIFTEANEVIAPTSDVMKTLAAFNAAGKRYDLILWPERPGNVNYRQFYMDTYRRYFREHLKPDAPPSRTQTGR
jgi:dipeptidyl aminopeptidase/acylaminoacyl peptidase